METFSLQKELVDVLVAQVDAELAIFSEQPLKPDMAEWGLLPT